jgi:hypothetical protein
MLACYAPFEVHVGTVRPVVIDVATTRNAFVEEELLAEVRRVLLEHECARADRLDETPTPSPSSALHGAAS